MRFLPGALARFWGAAALSAWLSAYAVLLAPCRARAEPPLDFVIDQILLNEALVEDISADVEITYLEPGEGSYGTFTWHYRSDYKQRLEGDFRQLGGTNREYTYHVIQSFDGEKLSRLRTRGERNRGVVKPLRYDIENTSVLPKTFLGYCLVSSVPHSAGLGFQLQNGIDTRIVDSAAEVDGHECIHLETSLGRGPGWPEYTNKRIEAWVDPACGYRPRKIEVYRSDYNGLLRTLSAIDLQEVEPGIWLPTAGNDEWFWHDNFTVLVDYETFEDYLEILRLPPEERYPLLSFETRERDSNVRMTVKNYRVNQGLPDSFFRLVFPEGTAVYDKILERGYFVSKKVSQEDLDALMYSVPQADVRGADTTGTDLAEETRLYATAEGGMVKDPRLDMAKGGWQQVLLVALPVVAVLLFSSILTRRRVMRKRV